MRAGAPAHAAEQDGVTFPVTTDGRRSTSALGRAVVADALARTDPAGARAVRGEANWRSGYLAHFRRLIVAGLPSRPPSRWPGTAWRPCTGGCGWPGRAGRRPGSARWSRRRPGTS